MKVTFQWIANVLTAGLTADPLRLVDPDVAARVDARRLDRRTRYLASVAKGGRVPERAHGKYLLSGGMLVCPTCGGHFEARIAPWKGHRNVYICSTRRRKPGVCTNTLALPIAETDDDVLGIVEGEVLGTRFLDELLAWLTAARPTTPPACGRIATGSRRRLPTWSRWLPPACPSRPLRLTSGGAKRKLPASTRPSARRGPSYPTSTSCEGR